MLEALLQTAERAPADQTVSDPFRALSFANLLRLANVMRRLITKATNKPHVGIMLPSTCAFAGTFYGALWAGRTVVPLNFLLQPAELSAVIADAGLDCIFTTHHFAEMLAPLPVTKIFVEDLPLKREMILERIRHKPAPPRVADDDTAILLYTSGTSGVPKGVCQTYANLRHDVRACIEKAELDRQHRFLGVLPLFHSFGLTAMLMVPVALGAAVHYVPRFSPSGLFEIIREHQSSVTIMIASMYSAMLHSKRGKADDLKTIRYCISGGEALSMSVHDRFKERFNVDVMQGYGMTECSPVVSLNIPRTHRLGTVGQPIPGVTVQSHDDHDQPLGADAVGELWVRGPVVMKGYYKKEADTRAAITPDGWYKTGDMGRVDADGFISITGRKKEMIIVGGENVYPREVENVLDEHPAVAECAVIGQTDTSRGEIVVGFAILKDGSSATDIELRDFCRERLAGYKVPRKIIIAESLPRGPTGKILKRKLTELL